MWLLYAQRKESCPVAAVLSPFDARFPGRNQEIATPITLAHTQRRLLWVLERNMIAMCAGGVEEGGREDGGARYQRNGYQG